MIRLLIVDDSALMRKLLRTIFESEGDFEIALARDGLEALSMIDAFNPHVVTLDVQMPNMDGLTCLDRIMVQHPCPVVMVSSATEAGAEETLTAMEMGAVDFVAKPSGAISLEIGKLAPRLVEKVRIAAQAHLRRSRRLVERLRLNRAAPMPRAQPFSERETGLVLIGCSTGGPSALDVVLGDLPADFAWPVVIAQHMPASFTGPLARRLDKLCALPVSEVRTPTPLLPGHVYVGKGDADVIIGRRNNELVALSAPASGQYRWHPSVDRLVETALKHVSAAQMVGVLMTGMGADGALAMKALYEGGGHTLAEAEETAVIWGMPGELVRLGGASDVLPLDRLGASLVKAIQ